MNDFVRYGLVGLIVLLTHFQEGITGFGCTVLALPFVVLLLGLKVAVPVLVIQAWILALCIAVESRRRIVWAEFGKIVALVGLGLPFGIWMAKVLPESGLRWVLAFFMIAVGGQGLMTQGAAEGTARTVSGAARRLTTSLLPLGGIIHGAFGSGGPLVVAYATKALPDKKLFRVTLCLLWFVLNTALIAQWIASSSLNGQILRLSAFCLPFTLVGLVLGNVAHYRINEAAFRRLVYAVLIASGLVLLWSLVR